MKRSLGLSEHEEQAAVIAWAHLKAQTIPELRLLLAIPNGEHRHWSVAKRLKAEGVQPGVPDLFLPVARGARHGLFLEMKTKYGKTSGAQTDWADALRERGYNVAVCYGAEAAIAAIECYLSA